MNEQSSERFLRVPSFFDAIFPSQDEFLHFQADPEVESLCLHGASCLSDLREVPKALWQSPAVPKEVCSCIEIMFAWSDSTTEEDVSQIADAFSRRTQQRMQQCMRLRLVKG